MHFILYYETRFFAVQGAVHSHYDAAWTNRRTNYSHHPLETLTYRTIMKCRNYLFLTWLQELQECPTRLTCRTPTNPPQLPLHSYRWLHRDGEGQPGKLEKEKNRTCRHQLITGNSSKNQSRAPRAIRYGVGALRSAQDLQWFFIILPASSSNKNGHNELVKYQHPRITTESTTD